MIYEFEHPAQIREHFALWRLMPSTRWRYSSARKLCAQPAFRPSCMTLPNLRLSHPGARAGIIWTAAPESNVGRLDVQLTATMRRLTAINEGTEYCKSPESVRN